jgi:hypothetical protein
MRLFLGWRCWWCMRTGWAVWHCGNSSAASAGGALNIHRYHHVDFGQIHGVLRAHAGQVSIAYSLHWKRDTQAEGKKSEHCRRQGLRILNPRPPLNSWCLSAMTFPAWALSFSNSSTFFSSHALSLLAPIYLFQWMMLLPGWWSFGCRRNTQICFGSWCCTKLPPSSTTCSPTGGERHERTKKLRKMKMIIEWRES